VTGKKKQKQSVIYTEIKEKERARIHIYDHEDQRGEGIFPYFM